MAGFAHAGHDHPAAHRQQHRNCLGKTLVQRGREIAQPRAFGAQYRATGGKVIQPRG
jgi:hypothetical protein